MRGDTGKWWKEADTLMESVVFESFKHEILQLSMLYHITFNLKRREEDKVMLKTRYTIDIV